MRTYSIVEVHQAPRDTIVWISMLRKLRILDTRTGTLYATKLTAIEVEARDQTVDAIPGSSARDTEYIRAYVQRKYTAFTESTVLPLIATIRPLLTPAGSPVESIKTPALEFRHKLFDEYYSMNALCIQRYTPQFLENLWEHYEEYDPHTRYEIHTGYELEHLQKCIDDDEHPIPAPASDDLVETDAKWADICEKTRERAIHLYLRKIYELMTLSDELAERVLADNSRREWYADILAKGFKVILPEREDYYTNARIRSRDTTLYVRAQTPVPPGYQLLYDVE